MTKKFRGLMGLALLLTVVGTAFVPAQAEDDEMPDRQIPPAVQEEPVMQQEAVKQEPAKPKECVTETSGFRRLNGMNQFYVELTNSCDRPHVCVLKAYVVGSEGGKTGRATVQVAAASKGQKMAGWRRSHEAASRADFAFSNCACVGKFSRP
jgi:hypothetical protein